MKLIKLTDRNNKIIFKENMKEVTDFFNSIFKNTTIVPQSIYHLVNTGTTYKGYFMDTYEIDICPILEKKFNSLK